jgi:acid phosphatase family membrane protein YuiD
VRGLTLSGLDERIFALSLTFAVVFVFAAKDVRDCVRCAPATNRIMAVGSIGWPQCEISLIALGHRLGPPFLCF